MLHSALFFYFNFFFSLTGLLLLWWPSPPWESPSCCGGPASPSTSPSCSRRLTKSLLCHQWPHIWRSLKRQKTLWSDHFWSTNELQCMQSWTKLVWFSVLTIKTVENVHVTHIWIVGFLRNANPRTFEVINTPLDTTLSFSIFITILPSKVEQVELLFVWPKEKHSEPNHFALSFMESIKIHTLPRWKDFSYFSIVAHRKDKSSCGCFWFLGFLLLLLLSFQSVVGGSFKPLGCYPIHPSRLNWINPSFIL